VSTAPGAAATPRVSVIVPAYNAAAHLRASVEEILGQTLSDLEVVVVDDGSTDDTARIGAECAERDPRVRFVPLAENGGVAAARERAVREARGDWIWFVDADDRRNPRALELLLAAAERDRADLVVCGARFVDPDGSTRAIPAPALPGVVPGRSAFRELLEGRITGHLWNKLVRRDLALGIEYTRARVHSDLAMTAQLVAAARRVSAIPDVLYSYLLREGSIIHSGRSRAESLLLVDDAVASAARRLDPRLLSTGSFALYRARFIVLSGLKDALLGPYPPDERMRRARALQARLTWRAAAGFAHRRDPKRLLLAVTAKTSLRLHRALLIRAARV